MMDEKQLYKSTYAKVQTSKDYISEIKAMDMGNETSPKRKHPKSVRRQIILKKCCIGALPVAAILIAGIFCVSNPVTAAKLPIIGNIFRLVSEHAEFAGDYGSVAVSISSDEQENAAYTQYSDGLTMTISEVYCNEMAIYATVKMTTDDAFPKTAIDQNENPLLDLIGTAAYSFLPEAEEELIVLKGKFIDEKNYIGMFRLDSSLMMSQNVEIPEHFQLQLSIENVDGVKEDWNTRYSFQGPFAFTLDLHVDHSGTVTVAVDEASDSYHISSVTKTPFELIVNEEHVDDANYIDEQSRLIVLDADGKELEGSGYVGAGKEYQVDGHNLSKVDIYLISNLPETADVGLTRKEILEANCRYHREVIFD